MFRLNNVQVGGNGGLGGIPPNPNNNVQNQRAVSRVPVHPRSFTSKVAEQLNSQGHRERGVIFPPGSGQFFAVGADARDRLPPVGQEIKMVLDSADIPHIQLPAQHSDEQNPDHEIPLTPVAQAQQAVRTWKTQTSVHQPGHGQMQYQLQRSSTSTSVNYDKPLQRPHARQLPPLTAATTLFQHPDAPFSIHLHDDGQVTLGQDLKLRRLVLSGGGAKGVVYPGAIKALEEQGQMAHIREVGGTSVGAITAAVIAAGMDANGCKTLLDNLNLPLLFSRTEKSDEELRQPSDKGPLRSQLSIAGNLGTEAPNLKKLINHATREVALARLGALGMTDNIEVERIRNKLQGGGNITFGDLRVLSEHVPGIKKLYCTGTALYSGPGVDGEVPQLAVFSTDNDAFKDMEISEAAVISSSLPVIFKKRKQAMPHDLAGDLMTETHFLDGGLTLNTPLYELIDPDAPPTESLIIGLEHPLMTQARDGKNAAPLPLLEKVVDVLVVKTNANNQKSRSSYKFVANELLRDPLAQQTVEARLKDVVGNVDYSGSKGTLALAMTKEEKDGLQADLQANVLKHLAERSGDRTFPSLDHLLFSLREEELQVLNAHADNTASVQPTLQQVNALKVSLRDFQNTMRQWPDDKSHESMVNDIRTWMAQIDPILGKNELQRDAFAEMLASNGDPMVLRMFDLLRDSTPAASEATDLHTICRSKEEARACHRIALQIRWNFLYPVRERMLQVGLNDDVLDQANQELSQAKTRQEINSALKRLEDNYKVAGLTSLNKLSPVIPKLRTYYLPHVSPSPKAETE